VRSVQSFLNIGRTGAGCFAKDLTGDGTGVFKVATINWWDKFAIDVVVIAGFEGNFAVGLVWICVLHNSLSSLKYKACSSLAGAAMHQVQIDTTERGIPL
jgi:hypothetical protein